MPIERNQALVTVAGVTGWKEQGKPFLVRYDLVKLGVKSGDPTYNCVYVVDGQEYVLVATNAGSSGFIEERKINLWPGVHRHHQTYGDGTMLVLDPESQTLSSWKVLPDGSATLHSQGKDLTEK
ncbi:hypothetical protein [Tritonibacter mobilis]|uniref:hypothetical protein n=1 Tax=Tritonibacter mobilis TaxID=379347 RepID=UPI00080696EF|nr:hypothetical protein [Tritonibacter mobilis]MCZ4270365.1 hypothetical protein [Rhodobacteraceae bacterium G21628-S1]NKX74053.1 hypothetical protein [Rhodobacteraceae bacterium R_SAG3]